VRERVAKSPGLTPEQQATLEARGYLSPDEIHKLAQATAGVVVAPGKDKADCHSDYVDPDAAKRLQAEKLVQLGRKPGASAEI
jgi:phosphomethylpyrimidine synthase